MCVCVSGVDSMANYELAIRQVRYRNWQPASLSERRFRLSCSELNGRYTSNNFNLEVRGHVLARGMERPCVWAPLVISFIRFDNLIETSSTNNGRCKVTVQRKGYFELLANI